MAKSKQNNQASEIYDKEKAKALLDNADHVLRRVKEILGEVDC